MTWDINNLATLSRYLEGGTVTFGDDSNGNIIGIDNIKIGSSLLIENVILIDGLKHNLLSISQLCDQGFKVIFDDFSCNVLDSKTNACILSRFGENNVYIIFMKSRKNTSIGFTKTLQEKSSKITLKPRSHS